jgi:biotin transport system substrate-specific component
MNRKKLYDITLVALFSAIIVICSLISVPSAIPFTLQTFAVFLSLCVLGAEKGILSIVIYIILGLVGLPVFSGFNSGLGALLNVTGGYISGFVFSGFTFWAFTALLKIKNTEILKAVASFAGLLICYIFGTGWYILMFMNSGEKISIASGVTACVVPFIIPDILKILLAVSVSKKIEKALKKRML